MSSSGPQLEDVPELMQLIQLHLPLKEAACTSVLSKSWLHAWSTIPTLRFCIRYKNMNFVDMDRTLTRYLRDNIPIERFDLDIVLYVENSASLAEKCIRTMATHKNSTTLKELSLSYNVTSWWWCPPTAWLPHEILSSENLTTIKVVCTRDPKVSLSMTSHSHDPVIVNCVLLRELVLNYVNISQELLDGILSSCKLLEKIDLIVNNSSDLGLNTIKVTNLPCLYQLKIDTGIRSPITLEINHVPNLRVFSWGQNPNVPFNAHSISIESSLKELCLGNMVNDASLDMLKSGAPLLENLTLDMENWELGSFHFTRASIKKLSLWCCQSKLTDVKDYASNLLFFCLDGATMPTLLFPLSTLLKETTFRLNFKKLVDVYFFLKMREALAISSNYNLYINTNDIGKLSLKINIGDLRTRVPFPRAMNVQQLLFRAGCAKCERSSFIDALFEICHPNQVTAMQDHDESATKNYFCKVMLMDVLEKKKIVCWLRYLEHVQIRSHRKWETLTNSHKSFLELPTSDQVDFKLEWR